MPDIETYVNDPYQDVQEPSWVPDSDIAGMQNIDDPNDEWQERGAIRNARGSIEFLDRLVDSVEDVADKFLETDAPIPPKRAKLDPIRTRELGSDKWRANRQVVTAAPVAIVEDSKQRRKVRIWNHGPNEVYLSSLPSVQFAGTGIPSNVIELPPVSATLFPVLEFETQDDVWAICAATETATLSVQQIYDMED